MPEQLTHALISEALAARLIEIKRLPVAQRPAAIEEAHRQADRLRQVLRAQERGKGCTVSADGKRLECW